MAIGKVKWFSDRKGYGFITMENSKDVFVHNSSLKDGLVTLSQGDKVEFELVESEKGPKAENVRKIR
ncbi:MAG: cold-shock protein [candidate division WOR-3 bacterium]